MSSPDHGFDPTQPLDPELNPLTNPVLAENLGRWSQVYFTTPPEKRADAVRELLRELAQEKDGPAAPARRSFFDPLEEEVALAGERFPDSAASLQLTSCPACQEQNLANQRYCGFCGSRLYPEVDLPKATMARPAAPVPERPRPAPAPSPSPASPASTQPFPEESDLQWLRDKAISRDETPIHLLEPEPSRAGWKYAVLAIVILLGGGFVYREWSLRSVPTHHASSNPVAPAASTAPRTPTPPQDLAATAPPAAEVPSSPTPAGTASASPQGTDGTDAPVPSPAATTPAAEPASAQAQPTPPAKPPVQTAAQVEKLATTDNLPATDDGHQELQLAQHYLEGPSRDSSAAAHWLWKSVSKQNATALLLLSNLYQTGDGVPKSCEQARLLLVAAAKKGNLDAAGQLRHFDSSTCR